MVTDAERLATMVQSQFTCDCYRSQKDLVGGMLTRFYGCEWTEGSIHSFLIFDLEKDPRMAQPIAAAF